LKRFDKELGLNDANAEKTTIARANAISDIRNLASFAAANHLMVPITNFNGCQPKLPLERFRTV
jgi:hypothetical protein